MPYIKWDFNKVSQKSLPMTLTILNLIFCKPRKFDRWIYQGLEVNRSQQQNTFRWNIRLQMSEGVWGGKTLFNYTVGRPMFSWAERSASESVCRLEAVKDHCSYARPPPPMRCSFHFYAAQKLVVLWSFPCELYLCSSAACLTCSMFNTKYMICLSNPAWGDKSRLLY